MLLLRDFKVIELLLVCMYISNNIELIEVIILIFFFYFFYLVNINFVLKTESLSIWLVP